MYKYKCFDPYTYSGFVHIKDLLFLDYAHTGAGSNPREFQGFTGTVNKSILHSIIQNHKSIFGMLHSGFTVNVINSRVLSSPESNTITFSDVCIVNGNQTRAIFLVLILIKLHQLFQQRDEVVSKISGEVGKKRYLEIVSQALPRQRDFIDMLFGFEDTGLKQVNSALNIINSSQELKLSLSNSSIEDYLDTRVFLRINNLDALDDDENDRHVFEMGSSIADAQNVKTYDLFWTKHGQFLKETIFKRVKVETDVQALDLLKLLIPTTLLVEPWDVHLYANNRASVYRVFDELIKKYNSEGEKDEKLQQLFVIIQNLMPELYSLHKRIDEAVQSFMNAYVVGKSFRENYFGIGVEDLKRKLLIYDDEESKAHIDKLLKRYFKFDKGLVTSIFIYATRGLISIKKPGLDVSYNPPDTVISRMAEKICTKLVYEKYTSQTSSFSDIARNGGIYEFALEKFKDYLSLYNELMSEKLLYREDCAEYRYVVK